MENYLLTMTTVIRHRECSISRSCIGRMINKQLRCYARFNSLLSTERNISRSSYKNWYCNVMILSTKY